LQLPGWAQFECFHVVYCAIAM